MIISTHRIRTKRVEDIVFRLNSDDYSNEDIKNIRKYLRANGLEFKESKTYSSTKIMSWVSFRVRTNKAIRWEDNEKYANDLLIKAIPNNWVIQKYQHKLERISL